MKACPSAQTEAWHRTRWLKLHRKRFPLLVLHQHCCWIHVFRRKADGRPYMVSCRTEENVDQCVLISTSSSHTWTLIQPPYPTQNICVWIQILKTQALTYQLRHTYSFILILTLCGGKALEFRLLAPPWSRIKNVPVQCVMPQ